MELIKKSFYTVLGFLLLKCMFGAIWFFTDDDNLNHTYTCGAHRDPSYKCNIFQFTFDSDYSSVTSYLSVGIIFVVIMLHLTYLALMDTYEKIQRWRLSKSKS